MVFVRISGEMDAALESSRALKHSRFAQFCLSLGCLGVATVSAAEQPSSPSTREMERINWMEFREWVPGKIGTVLLPLGTIEPHGVTANGADILAPVAIAKEIAPRLNAMIAPVIPYGFTGVMDAYPGSFTVPEDAYRATFVRSWSGWRKTNSKTSFSSTAMAAARPRF
jgi:Creatinine amidohydrolase